MEEQGINTDHLDNQFIAVDMSGIMFSAHIPFLVDDIKWMWNTYNHPEAKKRPTIIGDNDKNVTINFGDYNALEQVYYQLINETAVTA